MYGYNPYSNQNQNMQQNASKATEKKVEKKEDALLKFNKDIVNDGVKPNNDFIDGIHNPEKYTSVYMPPILIVGGQNALKKKVHSDSNTEKKDEH